MEMAVEGEQSGLQRLESDTPTLPERSAMYDRYLNMMKNFAEMIRGKENPYTYDYELGLYELILRSCRKEIAK